MRPGRIIPILAHFLTLAATGASSLAQPIASADADPREPGFESSHAARQERPESAGRIVARFNFEEREFNPLPIPMGWRRAQDDPEGYRRPGFPNWNRATLDYQTAAAGVGSVRLPSEGGSTSLVLNPGVISIFEEGDYVVTASILTSDLDTARAQLVVRLLDEALAPIDAAEYRSPLIPPSDKWTPVRVDVTGGRAGAAYMQLELLVLQPAQHSPIPEDAPYRVQQEDFHAAAWFDDILVIAVPRIELRSTDPAGLSVGDTPPSLSLIVRDLAGEDIEAETVIIDARGREVDRRVRAPGSGRYVDLWTPDLPEFGWYRARLRVSAEGRTIAIQTTDFAWAPPAVGSPGAFGPSAAAPRFALDTTAVPQALLDTLPEIIDYTSARAVTLGLWNDDAPPADPDVADRLEPLLDALVDDQTDITFSLARMPRPAATNLNIDRDDLFSLISRDPATWTSLALPLLDRFSQRINHWRFGLAGDTHPYAHPDLDDAISSATSAIASLAPAPVIDVPWRSDQLVPPMLARPGRAVTLQILPGTSLAAYRVLAADWLRALESAPGAAVAGSAEPPTLTVTLVPPAPAQVGARNSAAEVARNALAFWEAFTLDAQPVGAPPTLALIDPWRISAGRRPRVEPAPALAAWRTLQERLAGRRVSLRLPTPEGVHALLLEPPTGASEEDPAVLAIWADTDLASPIDLHLGSAPLTMVDIFDNRYPVEQASIENISAPAARLRPTREPIFVEGVDARLIRLLASVTADPPVLSSDAQEHRLTISMTNPWPTPIEGAIFIVEPGGYSDPNSPIDRSWRISPRKTPFVLQPAETLAAVSTFAAGLSEETGLKPLIIDLDLNADQARGVYRIPRALGVGLDGIDLTVATRRSPPGDPEQFLAVDTTVTNTSDAPISFDLVVIVPGQSRERRHFEDLPPGQAANRTFTFRITDDLQGQRAAVTLERTDQPGRLNKTVVIE